MRGSAYTAAKGWRRVAAAAATASKMAAAASHGLQPHALPGGNSLALSCTPKYSCMLSGRCTAVVPQVEVLTVERERAEKAAAKLAAEKAQRKAAKVAKAAEAMAPEPEAAA